MNTSVACVSILTSPSSRRMAPSPPSNPTLLPSLGRLVRGLSALFWGLPLALVVAVQTIKGEWFKSAGWIPAAIAMGLLLYGTHLLGSFQMQERIWQHAWERARLVALVNLGLSPFLFFWSKVFSHPFFMITVQVLMITSLLFLYLLNSVLLRLSAMLPDETLRNETTLFTRLNQMILLVIIVTLPFYFVLHKVSRLPRVVVDWLMLLDRGGNLLHFTATLVFVLLPVAMTMALLWKTKEVILSGVFSAPESNLLS